MSNMTAIAHEELRYMDHLSLRDMADFFERQAELIRQQSDQIAANNNIQARHASAVDTLIRSPRIVLRFLQRGCTLVEAQNQAAKTIGVPVGSIERAWKRFCFDKSHYELKRRNRLIIELAAMGFTNADIGKKVFLHPNSVSRIITKARASFRAGRHVTENQMRLLLKSGVVVSSDEMTA